MKIKILILFIIGMGFSVSLFSQKFLIQSIEADTKLEKNISINEVELSSKISQVVKGTYVVSLYNSGDEVFFLSINGDIGSYKNDSVWEILFKRNSRDEGAFSSSIIVVEQYIIVTGDGGIAIIDKNSGEKDILYKADRYNSFPLAIISFSLNGFVVQNQETLTKIYVKILWPRKETVLNDNILSFEEIGNKTISNFQVKDIMGETILEESIALWEKGIEIKNFSNFFSLITAEKKYIIRGYK